MLIVASPTSVPLCTDTPIPTDGQPQWWRCDAGEHGSATFLVPPGVPHGECDTQVGPFPFTVGRWAEEWFCPRHATTRFGRCCGEAMHYGSGQGFVTHLVEVVGPSHHARHCRRPCAACMGMGRDFYAECEPCQGTGVVHGCPDAAPDCWHTPTGKVTRIDPIPCERGWTRRWHSSRTWTDIPASVWTADDALAAKLTEVADA